MARSLVEAPIERIAEVVYGSNGVFLLELDAPDPAAPNEPLRAVYKPVRGERPLWDFPRRTLYLREVAAYIVDAALGLHRVPVTVLRDGPLGPGSVQRYVHVLEEPTDAGAGRRSSNRSCAPSPCSTCSSTTPTRKANPPAGGRTVPA